ncbi:cupin domain-containing protein [Telmatobacter sp. DSM 110680]|uniref:Cupin domain-containing protein n=1 Tax=Telmatobacter sp. DSM 110680 TaxID=3036704 RepID=A0AAU7DMS4_9BACT
MKRRSFLKSAAASFPFAGFDPTVFATSGVDQPNQGEVISAGKDRLGEVHSRGYSTILFKVLPRETSNGLFVIEHINLVNGGPPLHKHLYQEEYFYLISGEVRFAVGDKRLTLGAGDSILGPRGIPHTFAAVEGKRSHLLISFSPAGKMEDFLRDTAVPNPPVQDAEFFRRYGMELVGPSPFMA